jgi:hypothetical protein
MAKPTLSEVLRIKDPMLSDNFELLIPKVPGGGSAKALRIQCKTAVKPGSTVNEVLMELFGHSVVHAGSVQYSHDLPVTYLEDSKGTITKTLEAWKKEIRDHETQSGSYKEDYSTDAEFIIYDQAGKKVLNYTIVNIWPNQIPDLQFDGAASTQGIEVSASFKFDLIRSR